MRLTAQAANLDDIAHRLPTNTLSNSKRIQRWGNFIAGFSIEFVEGCLLGHDVDSGIVLDPFAGCGTTLVGAKNQGFSSVGYERHPVFYAISSGKISHYGLDAVNDISKILIAESEPIQWSDDSKVFLSKLFTPENLLSIAKASKNIENVPEGLRNLSVTLFLKACELSCGSMTDGIYKAPTTIKRHIPFHVALSRVAEDFQADIDSNWYTSHWLKTPSAQIFLESSCDMAHLGDNSVACCITSPPYLNNFDYAEMTRMHLYLLGWCSSWKNISESVRNLLITNTTTALNSKKTHQYQDAARGIIPSILISELDQIVGSLTDERKVRAGKKEYDYLVYPYYSQIMCVLKEVYRTLRPGGSVHWVVADAALYGVHIETHEHTAAIMREVGFRDVNVHLLRNRGHRWVLSKRDGAKKGLGEYYITGGK